ncbi:MAG: alpha/beta fold hydrolase [Acidimicrobiia bacterium]|nr:alpha/beta fold hydrolase [Acidimicrobiia bacterium]
MTELFDPLAGPFRHEGSNGEAAVLVHGFTGVPAHFRPMGQVLADAGYTVIAPLLAGHGTTIEDMAETGREDWVETVRRAYASVDGEHDRVHLVGLSMGGLISIIVGADTGAATITTINSPIVFRDKKIYLAGIGRIFQPEVRWPEEDPPDLDEEVRPYWLTYSGFPTKASVDLLSISRQALRTAETVSCPALVVQSLVDESVDPRSATKLTAAFGPSTRLVWLESSRHNALLDRERHVIHQAVLDRFSADSVPG